MFFPLTLQSASITLLAAGLGWWAGSAAAWSVLYGGAAALANTGLLLWRQSRPVRHGDAARHLRAFYRSSVERVFVIGAWLVLGLLWFAPDAPAMLAGFVAGVLVWVGATLFRHLAWKQGE
ncbi:MAG: ATP synthase subunit I [Thiobacillaceae bacterium]|nr:ATP synthase subunit I [Thiobacillaceae bacterium]